MSSWVQLLLALLAASLRCGAAEGDPLPAALVELVRSSPISSIEDLQLLLLTDSVDEEEEHSLSNGGHRLPRSLDAQPAQQALCKVRTEVVEVTRAMLDRSNANFLLWPPCVEVQRCSGCCNTKSLQCVPFVTHTRYLQVMKIEYVNKKPTYAKAVVSVVDHVECRCQQAPRAPAPKKKSARRPHSHKDQHRNQTLGQGHGRGQAIGHSKDELHQWDELKQNQRVHLQEFLDQHWSPRGDTFTQPGESYRLAGHDAPGETVLFAPHWTHNSSSLTDTKDNTENQEVVGRRHGNVTQSSLDVIDVNGKNSGLEGGDGRLLNSTDDKGKGDQRPPSVPRYNVGNEGRDEGTTSQGTHTQSQEHRAKTKGFSQPATPNPEALFIPVEANQQGAGGRFRPTKEPNPDPRPEERQRDNKTPEEDRMLLIEQVKVEEEAKELLLLHKRLDQEKELFRQQQLKREEEEREKAKETGRNSQNHPQNKHHHHLQTTTQKSETVSPTTTRRPSAPAGPRPPANLHPKKRRMRKNRKRISKAAMRAMLM